MKLQSIYFIFIVLLTSCNQTGKKVVAKANIKPANAKPIANVKNANDTLAIPNDTIPKISIPEGTVQVAEDRVDTASKVKILDEGDYNEQDGVGPKDAKINWKGIFYNKNNYYIRPAKIKFVKEHSEFDDDDKPEQMTGWRLKVLGKDTCSKLITGDDDLVIGPVKTVKPNDFYYAGQKQEFNYEGVKYTLYTTGSERNGYIYNFKLYIMANVKGHTINQLVSSLRDDVALHHGNDAVDHISIEFIGDIDGDKVPDIIINDGGYAFGSTSLYLSKPAGYGAILKLVAYFGQSD